MMPIPLHPDITYGPVRSRRLRHSLGLNVSPPSYKLCSFDCIYCQLGWSGVHTLDTTGQLDDFPSTDDFAEALEKALRQAEEIDNITFSGNGEPTLHPQFEQLVDIALRLKGQYFPKAKLGVLSNSTTVNIESARRALARLDFRIMKLDAGDIGAFRRINRPCPAIDYHTVVEGLKSLPGITLQTMFVEGNGQNTGEKDIKDWMERLREIKPEKVQVYSLHRPPADESLKEVTPEKLREIATLAQEAAGVPVEVIVASTPYQKRM
jgi:wyosine [tRNA(Phe)-imidazoG37] synthetase (radical SAM superfamily)